MLHSKLLAINESKKATAIFNIWQSKDGTCGTVLSQEECLAVKVETLQSKNQYRKQYEFFRERNDLRFCPPSQINDIEKDFMPKSTKFEILDPTFKELYSFTPSKDVEPLNILESFNCGVPEYPVPNCKGVRWFYACAIAKTLEELDSEISSSLEMLKETNEFNEEDLVLKTYIKDGGDGMGEVSVYKEKGDRTLPDKALRFSICILESTVVIRDTEYKCFKEENPNSVRRNRPLLEVMDISKLNPNKLDYSLFQLN